MMVVDLAEDELAIILRADGELELLMPELDEDEVVGDDVLIMSAFLIGFKEPAFRKYMLSLFTNNYLESQN